MQLALHMASGPVRFSRNAPPIRAFTTSLCPSRHLPRQSGTWITICGPHRSGIMRVQTRVAANDIPAKDGAADSAVSGSTGNTVGDLPSNPLTSHALNVDDEVEEEDLFASKGLVKELSDSNQFGKRGEAWVFAQTVVLLLVAFPPVRLKGLVELLSILAMSAGLVFIVYGLFSLGRNFFPLPVPRKKSTLVTTGMYGYVRHPLYAGLLLGSFGLALLTGSETRFAVAALLWWILDRKASLEEKYLEQIHPKYSEYRERVKKFIPFIY